MEKKGAFDYILLETTGLADPGNLAPLFWVDDGLGSTIYLDGIVTLVDAKNILKSLDDPAQSHQVQQLLQQGNSTTKEGGGEAGHGHDEHGPVMTTAHVQLSHADVIVVNKSDLVSEEELRVVLDRIESINELAKVHVTQRSEVPRLEGFLLDLHAYDQVSELDTSKKGHSHLDPVRSFRSVLVSVKNTALFLLSTLSPICLHPLFTRTASLFRQFPPLRSRFRSCHPVKLTASTPGSAPSSGTGSCCLTTNPKKGWRRWK